MVDVADDDDEVLQGLYENGHWLWSELSESLIFVSDIPPTKQVKKAPKVVLTSTIDFRSEVELIEQVRYRRRYLRKIKPGDPEIITLQDVKDIAIFTAPITLLTPALIEMLHVPTTERFLRALILYSAYFIQVSDDMRIRMSQLERKLRTKFCDSQETEYRENLADLRLLVAKEYSTLLIGGGDVRPFHHMGYHKKRSLTDKDARFFETFLRMCIQIVWLALGRKCFDQLGREIHRLFKTETFNTRSKNNPNLPKLSTEEKSVLFGYCRRYHGKHHLQSPLMNDIVCDRPIDYRLLGLGVVPCPKPTTRLLFFLLALHGPEEELLQNGVVLGILGMPRNRFDTMLVPLPVEVDNNTRSFISSQKSLLSSSRRSVQRSSQEQPSQKSLSAPRSSTSSSREIKSSHNTATASKINQNIYPNVVLPLKTQEEVCYPPNFPDGVVSRRPISEEQKHRWLLRLKRFSSHQG